MAGYRHETADRAERQGPGDQTRPGDVVVTQRGDSAEATVD